MGKTIFLKENPAQAIPGTEINLVFLNGINKHFHRGLDVDGDGALAYAADTGDSNAYVIALDPALDAYIVGMPIWFKAVAANTGASTLNINSLGAIGIKKAGADLSALDISAGQIVCVVYDGESFQLINPNISGGSAIRKDTMANLVSAATGTICFHAWATDQRVACMYPGDPDIGLIILGGTATELPTDPEAPERG